MSEQVNSQEEAAAWLRRLGRRFFGVKAYSLEQALVWMSRLEEDDRCLLQAAIKGTGFATEGFVPDGDIGEHTKASLRQLFEAAEAVDN